MLFFNLSQLGQELVLSAASKAYALDFSEGNYGAAARAARKWPAPAASRRS